MVARPDACRFAIADVKMQLFRSYALPVLLFGSEAWALTKKQAIVVHLDCLRQILKLRRISRDRTKHLWSQWHCYQQGPC